MIKWLAKKVLGVLNTNQELMSKMREDVRDYSSGMLADTLRSAFISDHVLSDAHKKYYESWDISRISNAVKEGAKYNLNVLVLKAVADQNKIMLDHINSEEFIDKIVERINRKQVGR